MRQRVTQPLRSLANMLEALREGDYTMRGRNIDPEDAIGEVMVEVNTLSRTLHDQRLEALEAGALLQKVIADVDIAVFGFDSQLRLRLVNRAGETLLGSSADELRGRRPPSSASPRCSTRLRVASSVTCSRAAPAVGRFAAGASARVAGRTSCS